MFVKVFAQNEKGKIEFTKSKLEQLMLECYERGKAEAGHACSNNCPSNCHRNVNASKNESPDEKATVSNTKVGTKPADKVAYRVNGKPATKEEWERAIRAAQDEIETIRSRFSNPVIGALHHELEELL